MISGWASIVSVSRHDVDVDVCVVSVAEGIATAPLSTASAAFAFMQFGVAFDSRWPAAPLGRSYHRHIGSRSLRLRGCGDGDGGGASDG